MSHKRNPKRERTLLGQYLMALRKKKTGMNCSQAAKQLGFKNRQNLDNYETDVQPPDSILIKIARLYRVPPDEVLRKAHWPQLILVPIVSIIDPERLPDNFIKEIERGLNEKERAELTRCIQSLLRDRTRVKQH